MYHHQSVACSITNQERNELKTSVIMKQYCILMYSSEKYIILLTLAWVATILLDVAT